MFTKDSRTENFLTSLGADFKYTNDAGFANLEDGWDTTNLARPVPIRDDAVLEYAALMESGSAAPAPILHDKGGKFAVLDGIQRLTSAKMVGSTKLSAYVVTCDSDDVLAVIRVLANARLQGRAEPPEWTRKRAVEILVVQRGLSVEEVARMGGWKPAEIKRTAKIIDWGFKIRSAGGPVLPDNMIETVSRYMPEEDLIAASVPIVEFFNTIKAAKFSNGDAEPYITEFFQKISKPSKRQALYTERLSEFQELQEVQTRIHGRRGAGLTKDINLRRSLKTAVTILDDMIECGDDIPYVDEFFKLLKSLEKKLRSVAPNPRPQESRVPADKWSEHAQS